MDPLMNPGMKVICCVVFIMEKKLHGQYAYINGKRLYYITVHRLNIGLFLENRLHLAS